MPERKYSLDPLHEELLRDVLQAPLTEEEALLWMVLLHTHKIRVREPLLAPLPLTEVHGLTWSSAADVIAQLWPDRNDQRALSGYWVWECAMKGYPETVEEPRCGDASPRS